MKIIKCLTEYIHEEIGDAKKYVEKAIAVKGEFPQLAEVFYKLSGEEMQHMNILHGEVEKLIAEHRRTKGDPPEAMLAVYDYLHEQAINDAKEVKILQEMYRSGP